MSTYWPYIVTFLSPILAFLSAYWFMRANRSYAETKEGKLAAQKDAEKEAENKRLWREGRMQAEKDLAEMVKTEKAERVQWQLKREAELASIAGILEESTEAHRIIAGLAATSQAHGGQLIQLDNRLNTMQQHINNLSLTHAKP